MSNDGMQPVKERWFVRLADLIATRGFRRMLWCLLIAWIGLIPGSFGWEIWNSRQERNRLLNHTDHHALLKACRDLIREYPDTTLSDPEHDTRSPEIIRGLGASWVYVRKDEVQIELHGGFYHHGVIAFAEGNPREGGWIKLIDGLWYYSG